MCIQKKVETLADTYLERFEGRDRRLFTKFLVEGYGMTTFKEVDPAHLDSVILAKVNLGMLITLCDDLADNPATFNPHLLRALYRLELTGVDAALPELDRGERPLFELGALLMDGIFESINELPHFVRLHEILSFDIQQVFLANRYSELLTGRPELANLTESRLYGPYNMGMVAAGIIDLMASSTFDPKETGRIREGLLLGQRLGRIANLISTYTREMREGDLTSEILISRRQHDSYKNELKQEAIALTSQLRLLRDKVKSVDLSSYADGVENLYRLHLEMEGII